MFCVRCGKEQGDALTSTGLCRDCFLETNRFAQIPVNVDFEMCVHCRARKKGEIWIDPPGGGHRLEAIVEQGALAGLVLDKRASSVVARPVVEPEDERNYTVRIDVSGVAEGLPFAEQVTTRARIKNATCTRCSRMMGNYYESIVQVRAAEGDLSVDELREVRAVASKVIDKIVDAGDRNAFVLKDEVVKGGLDVYVATNNAGRQMAKAVSHEFGGRVTEHAKIAGQKDGVDIWRMTFNIRLPAYRAGDVVVVKDEPLIVASVAPKTVTLRDLVRGHARTVEHDDLDHAHVLRARDAKEAVVVTQSESEVQILDPVTYATVDARKPPGMAAAGATVRVLRWDEGLIVLP